MIQKSILIVLLLGIFQIVHAGRPIETDDASVSDYRTCQVDLWTETAKQVRQDNFNAGCNFFENGEFSLGVADVSGNREDRSQYSLGYKHILKHFTGTATGYGLAVSTDRGEFQAIGNSSNESLVTAVSTVPLDGKHLLLHLNLGYLRYIDQLVDDSSFFTAAALDYSLNDRLGVSVETFSGVEDSLSWRLGARYALIPDFFQIDASYGSDFGAFPAAKVFTLGFGLTPKF